jgi:uncharacterized protein YbjT (DUF2867 family)
MKIVVIGGTGLIGSKLVSKLRADGRDVPPASPATGVDIVTGAGLAEALEGAEVVADVSNAPSWDDAAVMDFFRPPRRRSGPGRRCRTEEPTAVMTVSPSVCSWEGAG